MNFIDDYVDYACKLCDAPIVFHKFMARALIGVAVKNNIYFQFGGNKIFPNFWMLYFAPSGFRKSTSMRNGLRILDHTDKDLRLPVGFSYESLWPILERQPSGFLFYSEFGTFIENLKKQYTEGAQDLLTDLYDVPDVPQVRELKSGICTIDTPTVSIFGCIVTKTFFHKIKEDDIDSGFVARWLILLANKRERKFVPPDKDLARESHLTKALHGIAESLKERIKPDDNNGDRRLKISFTDDAKSEYIKWSNDFEANIKETSPLISSYFRIPVYAIKIAVIEALNDYSYEIEKKHLDRALELIDYAHKSLVNLENNEIASSDYQKMRKRVVDFIASHKSGVTRTNILRKVRFPRRDLNSVLETLVESGEVVMPERTRSKGAKKSTTFYVYNENTLSL